MWRYILALFLIFSLSSCLTYYEKNLLFHEQFAEHQFVEANELLDKNRYIQRERNKLLFLLDKGVTLQMMGEYAQSNKFLEQAYYYVEDFEQSIGGSALSLVTNDMALRYPGENFEKVFIHYYKAINFIMLDDPESAMVECRRINIKLNALNDRYKSENKYKRDAFAHVLMGLLYESMGEMNDAFIAYRNALEIYEKDYHKFFGIGAPDQLKKDIIRTAELTGFYVEREYYEKKFNMKYDPTTKKRKELVYVWHSGLGPVKEEWSLNFFIVRGQGGYISFVNKELGLDFGYYVHDKEQNARLGDLKVVRVAFPKYTFRKQILTGAYIESQGERYNLELLEDVNQIAEKSLRDRMLRELSKTLLRTALKQAAEHATRQENADLGALVSVLNAVTEKADTRNWQTLPARIYYTRIPIDSTAKSVELVTLKGNHTLNLGRQVIQNDHMLNFKFYHSIHKESLL